MKTLRVYEELLKRRRLGQTNLAVKPGIVGVSDQTKAEHLGTFDYAHLRVPLPRDLHGSGIFGLKTATTYPESYFLMRRSNDGYISSTGMFKAAFPWASLAEEEAERRYQKTFRSAGREEAGSVWIAPEEALKLADDYGLRRWIVALLDPSPIEVSTKDRHNPNIKTPPIFDINKATTSPAATSATTATTAAPVLPPSSSLRSTRARSTRSASPSKIATPSRKIASPRKSRATRSSAKAGPTNGEEVVEMTATEAVEVTATSGSLQTVTETGSVVTESVASEPAEDEPKEPSTVRIEVEERVEQHGDVETRNTNVKIDVPADHPELPTPDDPTKMIEEARRMVEEARELDKAAGVDVTSSKRKAEDLVSEDAEAAEERPVKVARRVETTEQRWKKEKVTRRALVGMGIMAAIGTAFQYFA
ncbi:uncharacterized protein EI97DRAFT_153972 [Westerdykella ornata]|uniref:HTH APSES-type domain-containing protein n=1 Tax=Westerdykella ornata TaxID=318751 RepID=A0A6A6JBL2_WESOR|nr:uncharacterized protein EI97DRAFT_153972 [Westerdykella ornata]KAF2273563.1 hypothetical protein EI97DRAFT_153972 [Westerdykella ornata]